MSTLRPVEKMTLGSGLIGYSCKNHSVCRASSFQKYRRLKNINKYFLAIISHWVSLGPWHAIQESTGITSRTLQNVLFIGNFVCIFGFTQLHYAPKQSTPKSRT
jgi:hypothetical protein